MATSNHDEPIRASDIVPQKHDGTKKLKPPTRRELRAGELFDFAVGKPNGFTYEDVIDDLEWDRGMFRQAVHDMRRVLADDQINLICEPQGARDPWRYHLKGNYENSRIWATNRIGDAETRIITIESVMHSVVNATDGRSIQGRKARKMQRTLSYLIGELADIENKEVV